jgi:hypothetical protein
MDNHNLYVLKMATTAANVRLSLESMAYFLHGKMDTLSWGEAQSVQERKPRISKSRA